MKQIIIAVLFLTAGLIGCESHFYRVKENSLHLYLKVPKAHTVSFAYSGDGYQLHHAKKIDSKTWVVTVPKGREFTYFYIVDGSPFLPSCRFKERDDFGSENCIFIPDM
jgi:hypothetical protein